MNAALSRESLSIVGCRPRSRLGLGSLVACRRAQTVEALRDKREKLTA
jgi:hypothetical protein